MTVRIEEEISRIGATPLALSLDRSVGLDVKYIRGQSNQSE